MHNQRHTRVLIAVDDTATSTSAARTAHRLFGDDAEYIVLNVAPTPMVWGNDAFMYGMVYPVSMVNPAASGEIPFAKKSAQDVADAAGLDDATAIGDTGDPAHAIVTAAADHKADVIVVGSHDRGWFSRLVMPSVAGYVVKESDVPVLIAR